jgi:hypothetical protein
VPSNGGDAKVIAEIVIEHLEIKKNLSAGDRLPDDRRINLVVLSLDEIAE